VDSADDPGWRAALGTGWSLFVPGALQWRMRKAADRGESTLVTLRSLWVAFTASVGLVGVVVIILVVFAGFGTEPDAGPRPVGLGVAITIIGAVVSLGAGEWLRRRPLDPASLPALAESYRKAFFLQVATAEAAGLLAFIGFIVSGVGWLYLIGLVTAWAQLALIAPTAGHLARAQGELRRRGSRLRLLDALALPPPPRAR
jgi:hypothetical protein